MHANKKQLLKLLVTGAALMSGAAMAQTAVSVWVHAGPGPGRDVYVGSVMAFNESQKEIKVDVVALPIGS